jgi:hypothetical protein
MQLCDVPLVADQTGAIEKLVCIFMNAILSPYGCVLCNA